MKSILLKIVRYGFFTLICLITLLALVVVEENVRGKYEWESYWRNHEAHGDSLDYKSVIPPLVPDDQNFAMIKLLRPLYSDPSKTDNEFKKLMETIKPPFASESPREPFYAYGDRGTRKKVNLDGWTTAFGGLDVLTALKKNAEPLLEISEGVKRPYSRFPIDYEKEYFAKRNHLSLLLQLSQEYQLRACAELQAGQTVEAAADVQTIFRLTNSVKSDPVLISHAVRIFIAQIGLEPLWEGLEDHRWTDSQLSNMQKILEQIDCISGLRLAFRGERALTNLSVKAIKDPKVLTGFKSSYPSINWFRFIPGLIYHNLLTYNRIYDTLTFPKEADKLIEFYRQFDSQLITYFKGVNPCSIFGQLFNLLPDPMLRNTAEILRKPYSIWARALHALSGSILKTLHAQVAVDEAITACALERYRLANGQYPESLDQLAPIYLNEIPHDKASGEAFHYKVKKDGKFLLYSIGNKGKDNGGEIVLNNAGHIDINKSDWVW